ncbi:MAG: DbpA RNA binding domain-containing protein, partial [Microvirga sp.]
DMVWFTLNVGRRNNADPRWLLPIICRLGHVTKREVGPIRIQDRDTRFGIVTEHAARFAAAIRKSHDEDLRIEPAGGAPSGGRGAGPGKGPGKGPGGKGSGAKPYADRKAPGKGFKGARFAKGDKPADGKPFEGKSFGDNAFGDKSFGDKSFEGKPGGFKKKGPKGPGPKFAPHDGPPGGKGAYSTKRKKEPRGTS